MAKATCIFCGGGPTTREHLFPDWINEHFRAKGPQTLTFTNTAGTRIQRKVWKSAAIEYRVVCQECNNTWMSGIEAKAKPMILDLMHGRPCQLDPVDQLDLGTWATMKAYVRIAGTGPEVSDQESRQMLMEHRRPAANVRVMLATHAPPPSLACFFNPVIPEESPGAMLSTPGFAITFVLGQGVVQVVGREGSSFTWPQVTPRMLDDARSIIPPFATPVDWPAGRVLDDSSIKSFAEQLLNILD